MRTEELFKVSPFSLPEKEKAIFFTSMMKNLMLHHYEKCPPYKTIVDSLGYNFTDPDDLDDGQFPFLPVQLFKFKDLRSVKVKSLGKSLTSSGTSSTYVSKVFIDRETGLRQSKALSQIVSSFIGSRRVPILFIDSKETAIRRNHYNARSAAILGFSQFSSKSYFLLDDNFRVNSTLIHEIKDEVLGNPFLIFGFTSKVYENFLEINLADRVDFSNGTLIHGGGWKKLENRSISNIAFKRLAQEKYHISRVFNYYGMAEQAGSIFMECEYGNKHVSIFSDVIIRDPKNFSPLPIGETGLIHVLSLLPLSYPGHSLLTEDLGYLKGEDCCACGRAGKIFEVVGRAPLAEMKGCSNVQV